MTISYTLGELAEKLNATLVGNPSQRITNVASLASATHEQISFFDDAKLLTALQQTQAAAVLTTAKLQNYCQTNCLVMAKPRLGFVQLVKLFNQVETKGSIHPTAVIGENCQIGKNVIISAHVVIGNNVVIGDNTIIYPNVTLYDGTQIGARTTIHSGVIIGADGFGYECDEKRQWIKIPQIGRVRIGDDVEIGANTTIDCGALDDTVIGNGVKIDNLVMIAHNVQIGDHTVIAGCSGIAGSTQIGKHCIVAGSAMIADHIKIADNVVLAGAAMVAQSVEEPGAYYSLTELLPAAKMKRLSVRFKQLDEMAKRIRELEKVTVKSGEE